ncbi:MAG: dockerin type I domain-containing protein [Nitrosomonas ureae]
MQHGDQFLFVATINPPYFNQAFDADILNSFVEGARIYAAQNLSITIPDSLVPDLKQYITAQLDRLVTEGRSALVSSVGMHSQFYSTAQLQIDLALYGIFRSRSGNLAVDTRSRLQPWWDKSAILAHAILEWLGPSEAHAQAQSGSVLPCSPKKSGAVLAEGQSQCAGDDYTPPSAIPPPPGCDPANLSTLKKCGLTKDLCEALPDHKVVKSKDGTKFCAPTKPDRSCPAIPIDNPIGVGNINCGYRPIVASLDPNDKYGTAGVGEKRFIQGDAGLHYTITFENKPTASAPAQVVTVTDQLDPQKVDLETFALGPMSFGGITVPVIAGMEQYTGGVDLRPDKNLIVTIKANLDKATGLATWVFTSLDPQTGELPEDALSGFLPANTVPPIGEGSVTFSIKPKPGLASNTEISNQASIVFDRNAPIKTPAWINTIDATPPTSQMVPLPSTKNTPSFPISWSGSDIGAGIAAYSIFVSVNNGPFLPFLSDTDQTSTTFTGQTGSFYRFYSVARDAVGHTEDPPSEVDTSTTIIAATQKGDVNGDGLVNCTDMGIIRASLGKRSGQAGFDSRADVNQDGVIDVRDLSTVSRLLPAGVSCP